MSGLCNELGALLDCLKHLQNITFVFACGEDPSITTMIARICDHTEVLPVLRGDKVIPLIRRLRKRLHSEYPDDIATVNEEKREYALGLDDIDNSSSPAARIPSIPYYLLNKNPITYLATLLNNPRTLKRTIRKFWYCYYNIHGEVDADELLVISAIRFASPEGFSFIARNIENLRSLPYNLILEPIDDESRNDSDSSTTSLAKLVLDDFQQIQFGSPDIKKATKALIKFLFDKEFPQGIKNHAVTDYWVRINAEEVSDSPRDQEVLRQIEMWKKAYEQEQNNCHPLVSNISRKLKWAEKVNQFGNTLSSDALKKLAHMLFIEIKSGKVQRVERRGDSRPTHYCGYLELLELAYRKDLHKSSGYDRWIREEILVAFEISLDFANSLFDDWCPYDWSGQGPSLEEERKSGIRMELIEKAQTFLTDANVFPCILNPLFPYSLCHFIVLFSDRKRGGISTSPEEWCWITDFLLQATENNPQLLVPEISNLFWELSPGKDFIGTYPYFNSKWAKGIFGDKLPILMHVLTSSVDLTAYSEEVAEKVKAVQKYARDYLKKESNQE